MKNDVRGFLTGTSCNRMSVKLQLKMSSVSGGVVSV